MNDMVLALDLATRTGFAFGRVTDSKPTSGSIRFGGIENISRAARYRDYRKWLADLVNTIDADVVCYERPFVGGGKININTVRLLFGLAEHTEELFYASGIKLREASISEVRTHFCDGRSPRGPEGKALVQAKCRLLGWEFDDDNAADAMALWSLTRSKIMPSKAMASTPLFSR